MVDFYDVKEFQIKFGQLVNDKPVHLTRRKLEERLKFIQEELDEFEAGVIEQDLAQQADALVDIVYVALGTAVMLGLPWRELWDDVHRANMAKVPGKTHRGNLVDVTKPEGWVGPKTKQILVSAGYDESLKHEEHDDAIYK